MLPLLILKKHLILSRETYYGQFFKSKLFVVNCFFGEKHMYGVVKVRGRDEASLIESIYCLCGVKQGDVCSLRLFSFFVNELALGIIKSGKPDSILTSTLVEIVILLFVDDIFPF